MQQLQSYLEKNKHQTKPKSFLAPSLGEKAGNVSNVWHPLSF